MKATFLPNRIYFRQATLRIEIGFWRVTIDLLSDSKLIQNLVTRGYDLASQIPPVFNNMNPARAARWAAAGLGLGLFTALVSAILLY